MDLRLSLRQTVTNVKKLTSDIGYHLDDTIKGIEQLSVQEQKEKMLDYLAASKLFLQNVENQMNAL